MNAGLSCTRWRASRLDRIANFIDREWPHTGWIVALFVAVALAVSL